jgi:pimeloyl-ACP methyl ester carboxylesterase
MPYAHLNGWRCHYLDEGSGPVLVLLHGLGSSARDWEKQLHVFSQHFRIIAPDLRGFGASQRTGPYSVQQFADDVWALLAQLQVKRFSMLGYSMGGAVAIQMALSQPRRVLKLLISNSVPSFQPRTRQHWLMLGYRIGVMSLLGPGVLGRMAAARMFPKPEQEELRRNSALRGSRNSRWSYLRSLLSLTAWSVLDHLKDLTMPTMVLAAEHDFFSREETLKFAHSLPRGRVHIFPDTRHALPLENPGDYNAVVLKFLLRDRRRRDA